MATKWKDRSEAYKERRRAHARKKRLDNIEETRAYEREKKQRQRERRGEEINARQRENYAANSDTAKQKIYAGRVRRNPAYGMEKAVRDFERGDRSLDELNRLYGERLALMYERTIPGQPRKRNDEPRFGSGSNGGTGSERDKRTNEDED